jgi:hypothetical protein
MRNIFGASLSVMLSSKKTGSRGFFPQSMLARHTITTEFNLNLDRTCRTPMPTENIVSLLEDDLGDILYHILKLAVAYDINMVFRKAKRE